MKAYNYPQNLFMNLFGSIMFFIICTVIFILLSPNVIPIANAQTNACSSITTASASFVTNTAASNGVVVKVEPDSPLTRPCNNQGGQCQMGPNGTTDPYAGTTRSCGSSGAICCGVDYINCGTSNTPCTKPDGTPGKKFKVSIVSTPSGSTNCRLDNSTVCLLNATDTVPVLVTCDSVVIPTNTQTPTNTPIPTVRPTITQPAQPTEPPPPNTPVPTTPPAIGSLTCDWSTNTAAASNCSGGDYCVQFFPIYDGHGNTVASNVNQCWNFTSANSPYASCNTNSINTYNGYTKTSSWQNVTIGLSATENGGNNRNAICSKTIQIPPNSAVAPTVAPPPSGCVNCYLCDTGVWRFAGKPGGGCYTSTECTAAGYSTSSTKPSTCVWVVSTPTPPRLYNVNGYVYVDSDGDGVFSTGDTKYTGSTIIRYNGNTKNSNQYGSSWYNFGNLPDGTSSNLTMDTPSGFGSVKTNFTNPISVSPDQTNKNFLLINPRIKGNVYDDFNHNGIKDTGAGLSADAGHNLATVTLTLPNGTTQTATTNSSGDYDFGQVASGTYTVTLTVPYTATQSYKAIQTANQTCNPGNCIADPTQTTPTTISQTITPNATNNGIVDFYVTPLSDIYGTVYLDSNANGTLETTGINSDTPFTESIVSVTLTCTVNCDNVPVAILLTEGSNITNGTVTFHHVLNATYTMSALTPTGYKRITPVFTNAPTVTISGISAAGKDLLVEGYTLSGNVYDDLNHNGSKNIGTGLLNDTGHNAATVKLYQGTTLIGNPATTDTLGNYSFSIPAGTYKIELTVPNPYKATTHLTTCAPTASDCYSISTQLITINQSVTITNADVVASDFGITPYYSVSGTIYLDIDDSGTITPVDIPFIDSVVPVTLTCAANCSQIPTTGYNGNSSITDGTYTIEKMLNAIYSGTIPTPTGYRNVLLSPQVVLINGASLTGKDYLVQGYTIAGSVFEDKNKDGLKNGADINHAGANTICFTNATIITCNSSFTTYPTSSTNNYLIGALPQGTYTIQYTNLPLGYAMTYPLNGSPPSYSVTVGSSCATDTSHSSICDTTGSIASLNFGITNEFAWIQGLGGDMRIDTGFSIPVPSSTYANLIFGASHGIMFGGDSDYTFCAGKALTTKCPERASANRWIAGGPLGFYPEKFVPRHPGIMRTSYDYLNAIIVQNGAATGSMATACGAGGLSSCDLDASNLPPGVYTATGNVVLVPHAGSGKYQFAPNGNWVFLINGNLLIQEDIIVPNGSTATVSVSGNITVDKSVGVTQNNIQCNQSNHAGCNIEGLYSADGDFIIDSNIVGTNICNLNGTSFDTRLNLQGSFVANAKLTATNRFVNRRDLCVDDPTTPTVSIFERPDFIINAPDFLKHSEYAWQEIAP